MTQAQNIFLKLIKLSLLRKQHVSIEKTININI